MMMRAFGGVICCECNVVGVFCIVISSIDSLHFFVSAGIKFMLVCSLLLLPSLYYKRLKFAPLKTRVIRFKQ